MNKIAKDMRKVYRQTSTFDLIRNRSRKTVELARWRKRGGYWAKKAIVRLEYHIAQIDAEIACRADQQPLF